MKKDYTHVAIVLDRSGSMSKIASDTIGGFNNFIADQQKTPGTCTVTLVQFDDVIETVYSVVPVSVVPKLNFQPRNSTALLDAIGQTINETGAVLSHLPERDRPAKVVFVIITDGLENASTRFTRDKIFEMIKHQREHYSWEFVFLGANQDAIASGMSMGTVAANNLTYAHNSAGTKLAFAATSANLRRFRSGEVQCMAYTDKQRKEQDDAATTGS